jgi:hypothetical protein
MRVHPLFLLMLIFGVTQPALGQVSDLSRLNGRVEAGAPIVVTDDLGRVGNFRFVEVDPAGALRVTQGRGREIFTLTSDRVTRIEEIRNDPVGKGLGIGAGVGAGLTLLAIAGCDQLNYDVGECALGGVLIYLLPGMGIGALIDYAVKERATIYQSRPGPNAVRLHLEPIVSLRGGGAQLALRF